MQDDSNLRSINNIGKIVLPTKTIFHRLEAHIVKHCSALQPLYVFFNGSKLIMVNSPLSSQSPVETWALDGDIARKMMIDTQKWK